MLCFMIREPGIIIGVYIGYTVLISNFLIAQLSQRYEWFMKITDYLLQSQMVNAVSMDITANTAITVILYTLIVTAVTSFLGCMVFKRTDIA